MDNKSFISLLARRLDRDSATVAKLTEGLSTIIKEQCSAEGRVAIPGFGTFAGIKHEETVTNDLSTGKRMLLPPSIDVVFIPGSRLKKNLEAPSK